MMDQDKKETVIKDITNDELEDILAKNKAQKNKKKTISVKELDAKNKIQKKQIKKNTINVKELESSLSVHNSKSTDYKKVSEHIKDKKYDK